MSLEDAVMENPATEAQSAPTRTTNPAGHSANHVPPSYFALAQMPSPSARIEREVFAGATCWRHLNTSTFHDLVLFTDQGGRRFMLKKVSEQKSEWLLEVFVDSLCVRRGPLFFEATPSPEQILDAIVLADKERFSAAAEASTKGNLSDNPCEAAVAGVLNHAPLFEAIKKPVFEDLAYNKVRVKYQCLLLDRPVYLDLEASKETGHIIDKSTKQRIGLRLEPMREDLVFTGETPLVSIVRREFRARTSWHKKFMV
jgi:hypothetical protein